MLLLPQRDLSFLCMDVHDLVHAAQMFLELVLYAPELLLQILKLLVSYPHMRTQLPNEVIRHFVKSCLFQFVDPIFGCLNTTSAIHMLTISSMSVAPLCSRTNIHWRNSIISRPRTALILSNSRIL